MVLDARQVAQMKPVLILSDGRMGHLNQSIAFCSYIGKEYDILDIALKNRFFKAVSYLFDFLGIYTMSIFDIKTRLPHFVRNDAVCHSETLQKSWQSKKKFLEMSEENNSHDMVIGAGSGTYYAVKVIAKILNAKSVAMMLPRGYRYDFDMIFAQTHDNPPRTDNIIAIPANFAHTRPQGLYSAKKRSIGIIVGGSNNALTMSKKTVKSQLDAIAGQYPDYEIAVTSSPRTPKEIEQLIQSYHFDYELLYSENPLNPIGDFLSQCETVFITADSTSMISEAISYGTSNVEVLPLESNKPNKFTDFINSLEEGGYLHRFDGTIRQKNRKIDFTSYAKKVDL